MNVFLPTHDGFVNALFVREVCIEPNGDVVLVMDDGGLRHLSGDAAHVLVQSLPAQPNDLLAGPG